MKKLLFSIILYSTLISSFGQVSSSTPDIFNVKVINESNDLVVYMSYDGPYPAGEVQGLPRGGENEALTDFTITFRWPTTLTLTLGSVNNTAGLAIAKSGGILDVGGYKIQKFYQTGAQFFQNNFIQNTDFEVFRIPITLSSGYGVLEIAPIGFLPNQPNVSIDYFQASSGSGGDPDIYEYYPPDILESTTLQVSILSFSVDKFNSKTSKLNWSTSSETNSSHFGIERSLNGFRWETIGRVAAAGTSRVEKAYRFFDDQLPRFTSSEQEVYYRLKLCDQDGRYQYSEIRSVLFERNEGFIQVYPNPATQKLYIDLSGIDHNGEDMELTIIGMDGSLVMRKTFRASDKEPVEVDQLPANTYQIMVKHGDQVYQQRMVKVD